MIISVHIKYILRYIIIAVTITSNYTDDFP